MKKISFVLALIIVLGCVLTSCGGRSYTSYTIDPDYQSDAANNPNQTIQDLNGNKISVPKDIKNIVCFSADAAIILRSVGKAKLIKADDEVTNTSIPVDNIITAEQINDQEADIIFITESYNPDEILNGTVPYITVPDSMTINDIKNLVGIIEKITGWSKDSLANAIDTKMSLAQQNTKELSNKFTAFIDLGEYKTTGTGTYVNEVLNVCGCESIFASEEGYLTASKEQVIAANPDFIFTTGDVSAYRSDADYRTLSAVKEGRVISIDPATINFATNDIAKAIETINESVITYLNNLTK